jgi:hypothetical protein
MKNNIVAACLLFLLAQNAVAGPIITDISGPLTEAEISTAIAAKQKWLDKAYLACRSTSLSGCDISLNVKVSAAGRSFFCNIDKTDILSKSISSMYCTVISAIILPEKSASTSFTLFFNNNTQAPLFKNPASPGNKAFDYAPEAPVEVQSVQTALPRCASTEGTRDQDSIRACFDKLNARLNAIFQDSLQENRALKGAVKLEMLIEDNGAASEVAATLETGSPDAAFIEKITTFIKSVNFGKATEPKRVTYHIHLFASEE